MNPKEILIEARKLISDPYRWTKGVEARDSEGNPCANIADGHSFCAIGATRKVAGTDNVALSIAQDFLDYEARNYGFMINSNGDRESAALNDSCSHAEVLAMFDRAIDAVYRRADFGWTSRVLVTDCNGHLIAITPELRDRAVDPLP